MYTHFKSAKAFAWADWLVLFPLFILSCYGIFQDALYAYLIWFALGILSIYFSIIFWVMEKEYVYPKVGAIVYYTYYWGFFLYWGIIAIIYSLLNLV